jgi:hypothetical protein
VAGLAKGMRTDPHQSTWPPLLDDLSLKSKQKSHHVNVVQPQARRIGIGEVLFHFSSAFFGFEVFFFTACYAVMLLHNSYGDVLSQKIPLRNKSPSLNIFNIFIILKNVSCLEIKCGMGIPPTSFA